MMFRTNRKLREQVDFLTGHLAYMSTAYAAANDYADSMRVDAKEAAESADHAWLDRAAALLDADRARRVRDDALAEHEATRRSLAIALEHYGKAIERADAMLARAQIAERTVREYECAAFRLPELEAVTSC